MKLTFLGTRGNIEAKTARHRRHSAILITSKKTSIIIDWGLDWLNFQPNFAQKAKNLKSIEHPDAIFITHAHPDHAEGLKHGAPYPACSVYATKDTWQIIQKYPIAQKITLHPYKKVTICSQTCCSDQKAAQRTDPLDKKTCYDSQKAACDIQKTGFLTVQPFPVIHSLNAPAVGYKISDGKSTIFYVPDLVEIIKQETALKGVNLYIGDGASITRPIIKKRVNPKDGKITQIGHTTIKNQIKWCALQRLPFAIFTHCGSQIVQGDGRKLGAIIRKFGKNLGVKVKVAHDWMVVEI